MRVVRCVVSCRVVRRGEWCAQVFERRPRVEFDAVIDSSGEQEGRGQVVRIARFAAVRPTRTGSRKRSARGRLLRVGMRRWANKQINLPEIEGVESACLAEAVERGQVGPHIVQPVGVGRVLVDVPRLGRWRQCSVVVVVVCTAKPREQRDVRNVVRQTNRSGKSRAGAYRRQSCRSGRDSSSTLSKPDTCRRNLCRWGCDVGSSVTSKSGRNTSAARSMLSSVQSTTKTEE